MVIIENTVEDSIEVKYEDEFTTHNPQVLVDLLKMTIQYVDFLGVENFWSGRFQISKMNLRTSLFQEERSDVRYNLLFNYCNLLFFDIFM